MCKRFCYENPSAVDALTSLKNYWNLQKISKKESFLVRSEILGLLVNTLTPNYEYLRSNRENLLLPVQMQLSEKPKSFCCIFIAC